MFSAYFHLSLKLINGLVDRNKYFFLVVSLKRTVFYNTINLALLLSSLSSKKVQSVKSHDQRWAVTRYL